MVTKNELAEKFRLFNIFIESKFIRRSAFILSNAISFSEMTFLRY